MGDHKAGELVFFDDFRREGKHFFCRSGVKRGCVLIEKQQLRGIVGRHHERQGLPLPAGKKPHGLAHAVL